MSLHNIDRRYTWSPFCLVNCLGCVDGYGQGNNNSSSRQSTVCMKWVGESKDCIRERERYNSIKWKCIRQWCFLFGCIIVMITTDYGIGEYILELSNHDRRQNTTINFHAGFNFQRDIIVYIEFSEPSESSCSSSASAL